MAQKVGARSYVECSARTGEGVREVFQTATKAALAVSYSLWYGRVIADGRRSTTGAAAGEADETRSVSCSERASIPVVWIRAGRFPCTVSNIGKFNHTADQLLLTV